VNALITSEVEWAAEILMRDADGGMIVTESAPSIVHLDFIVTLPAAGRLSSEGQARDFARAKRALESLTHATPEHGEPAPRQVRTADRDQGRNRDQWREEMNRANVIDNDCKNPRTEFRWRSARQQKLIGCCDDLVWLARAKP